MPKAYLTFAEREKAEFIKHRDQQLKAIQGELATTKHTVPIHEIENKVDFSRQVITKVRNKPASATLEQLFAVCHACGKKMVITIE
jgi:hypothetical protein